MEEEEEEQGFFNAVLCPLQVKPESFSIGCDPCQVKRPLYGIKEERCLNGIVIDIGNKT